MTSQNASENATEARAPQRARGKARVAALLAAASDVFAEKGVEAATMTEVAACARASIGSLYQFFPTKELLAEALHLDILEQFSAMLARLGDTADSQDAGTLMDRLFAELATFLKTHPAFVALADRRNIDKERKRQTRTRLRAELAALLSKVSPPLPAGKPEVLAVVILHQIRVVMALYGEEDLAVRDAALAELAAMMKGHLHR
jgi:AcrR family transcriptional regulator